MKTIKNIEKIQTQICDGRPLWICLDADIVGKMAIGWISKLSKHGLIGLPTEMDLKNHEAMNEADKKTRD